MAFLERFGIKRVDPEEKRRILTMNYSERIAILNLLLEYPHRLYKDGSSRQKIPGVDAEALLNGRSEAIGLDVTKLAYYYACASSEGGRICIGQNGKRIEFRLEESRISGTLQERVSPGVWRNVLAGSPPSLSEVERLIVYGEKLVGVNARK